MKVHAKVKFVRISPRKARLVVDQVRGLPVAKAESMLAFMNKKAAEPVLKLIKSAVANAEHNYKLEKKNLVVKEIFADEGFTIKRYRPRAFGRAGAIRKRTSHISVVLEAPDPQPEKKAAKPEKKKKADTTEKKVEKKDTPKKAEKAAPKKEEKKETTK